MIKKFVSNALLSVVMDKDARKKLQSLRASEAAKAEPVKSPSVEKTGERRKQASDDASGEDVIETIAQALAVARAEISQGARPIKGDRVARKDPAAPKAPVPSPPPSRTAPKPGSPHTKPPASSPERERLIQQAMAIHRQKAHVLEELDPAMREKLMVMAMYVMDPSSLPPEARKQAKIDAGKEGLLVDDLGAAAGKGRKNPPSGRQ